jgi:hypothetical protein
MNLQVKNEDNRFGMFDNQTERMLQMAKNRDIKKKKANNKKNKQEQK